MPTGRISWRDRSVANPCTAEADRIRATGGMQPVGQLVALVGRMSTGDALAWPADQRRRITDAVRDGAASSNATVQAGVATALAVIGQGDGTPMSIAIAKAIVGGIAFREVDRDAHGTAAIAGLTPWAEATAGLDGTCSAGDWLDDKRWNGPGFHVSDPDGRHRRLLFLVHLRLRGGDGWSTHRNLDAMGSGMPREVAAALIRSADPGSPRPWRATLVQIRCRTRPQAALADLDQATAGLAAGLRIGPDLDGDTVAGWIRSAPDAVAARLLAAVVPDGSDPRGRGKILAAIADRRLVAAGTWGRAA